MFSIVVVAHVKSMRWIATYLALDRPDSSTDMMMAPRKRLWQSRMTQSSGLVEQSRRTCRNRAAKPWSHPWSSPPETLIKSDSAKLNLGRHCGTNCKTSPRHSASPRVIPREVAE
jgi:hypothetical protein